MNYLPAMRSIVKNLAVWVAALGYFVDIYDLLLFSIIRIPSLESIGISNNTEAGLAILNVQMFGLLLGGIIWGVLGDKLGRTRVLFLSILLYSLANIANGFVQTLDQYTWLRFAAGLGLAGELGAGITLVSELLPKEKRGLGTSFVAGVGLTGAVAAYFIAHAFEWRISYFIGGGMGLLLLGLRVGVLESSLYQKTVKSAGISKGNFLKLFHSKERALRYFRCILIGLPTWFVIGILVSFSDKFGQALGLSSSIDPGKGILFAYAAIAIGDVLIGLLSQYLKSRKKALHVFYGITMVGMALFFTAQSTSMLYFACGVLGFGTGFWAIFVTIGAENFGTNLRATAATTIPNMVRGSLNGISALFLYLTAQTDYLAGGIWTGIIVMAITYWAISGLQETFGKDLDYLEE
jgi:MFS family permease